MIIVIAITVISCEKDITVDLPRPDKALVIEGSIENGEYAVVRISRNLPYFELLDSAALANALLVFGADITVSDGTQSEKLTMAFDRNLIPPFIYKGSLIKGEVGKKYTLTVRFEGNEYSGVTTIPQPVQLDSIGFKLRNPSDNDSIGLVWIYFRDPDSTGNYYRIFTKTVGKDNVFVHPNSSVADDKLINGRNMEYAVSRGRNPNVQRDPDEKPDPSRPPYWAFIKGETVVVKFSSIDRYHFDFWKSVSRSVASDGNPFASPASVKSNLSGGALGIWGGYGSFVDTIKISPKN